MSTPARRKSCWMTVSCALQRLVRIDQREARLLAAIVHQDVVGVGPREHQAIGDVAQLARTRSGRRRCRADDSPPSPGTRAPWPDRTGSALTSGLANIGPLEERVTCGNTRCTEVLVQPIEVEQVLHRGAEILVLEDRRLQIHVEAADARSGMSTNTRARLIQPLRDRRGRCSSRSSSGPRARPSCRARPGGGSRARARAGSPGA